MNWINIAIQGLSYAIEHRKEIAEGAECGIHVLRRIEHLCVHHKTTADELLKAGEQALHEYNDKDKAFWEWNKESNEKQDKS